MTKPHLNPAAPKWKQWRADYYGTKPVLNPISKRTAHRVTAGSFEEAAPAEKKGLFGKLFRG